jgi:peptidoglycan/xylan/chitin deacetylase (PgdA/CDA1 family)
MSLRGNLKRVIGTTCKSPLFRPYIVRSFEKSINVVYYHYIGSAAPHYRAFYNGCTTATFAEHLSCLSRVFEFASLNEVLAAAPVAKKQGRPLLAITFDDGLDLNQEQTLELLARYKIKATTFVITSCLDNRRLMWRHALSAIQNLVSPEVLVDAYNALAQTWHAPAIGFANNLLSATSQWETHQKDDRVRELWKRCGLPPQDDYLGEKKPYFSMAGLRDWIRAGHNVGFHTHTHPYCSKLEKADLQAEILEPAKALKEALKRPDLCLSYPFGDRLQPALETAIYQFGLFRALFGIRGFASKKTSFDRLERAGAEGVQLGWPVFAVPVHKYFNRSPSALKEVS